MKLELSPNVHHSWRSVAKVGEVSHTSPCKIIATLNDLQTERKYHLTKTKLFVGDNLDPFVIANLSGKTQRNNNPSDTNRDKLDENNLK